MIFDVKERQWKNKCRIYIYISRRSDVYVVREAFRGSNLRNEKDSISIIPIVSKVSITRFFGKGGTNHTLKKNEIQMVILVVVVYK